MKYELKELAEELERQKRNSKDAVVSTRELYSCHLYGQISHPNQMRYPSGFRAGDHILPGR